MTRRAFFGLLRGTPAPAAAPVAVTAEVQARADAFRAALAARGPDEGQEYAVLTSVLCLLRLGTECSTCVEACAEPGALTVRDRAVRIDPSRCTGCGQCAQRCPAPVPAIAMRRSTP